MKDYKKMENALLKSIKHWKENVRLLKLCVGQITIIRGNIWATTLISDDNEPFSLRVNFGASECECCKVFKKCGKCPVGIHSTPCKWYSSPWSFFRRHGKHGEKITNETIKKAEYVVRWLEYILKKVRHNKEQTIWYKIIDFLSGVG